MNESDQNKKLNISYHNKSKSGFNSSIKFPGLHCNIFNIKNGNFQRTNNNIGKVKNFKSISPKIQRRNLNNCALKMKYKSKNQNRNKTNSKSKNKSADINIKAQINLIMKRKKSKVNSNNMSNINISKPLTLEEKMDMIISKNIISLTKKLRKSSASPKNSINGPLLIKNKIMNSQCKIIDNSRGNHFFNNNNLNHNVVKNSKSRKK